LSCTCPVFSLISISRLHLLPPLVIYRFLLTVASNTWFSPCGLFHYPFRNWPYSNCITRMAAVCTIQNL
jgi:hypothetical protein